MSTITQFGTPGLHLGRFRLAMPLPVQPARPAPALPAPDTSWLERLAAWADRQPPRQHRLGSYTALLR